VPLGRAASAPAAGQRAAGRADAPLAAFPTLMAGPTGPPDKLERRAGRVSPPTSTEGRPPRLRLPRPPGPRGPPRRYGIQRVADPRGAAAATEPRFSLRRPRARRGAAVAPCKRMTSEN
jgi:hypothetical protein